MSLLLDINKESAHGASALHTLSSFQRRGFFAAGIFICTLNMTSHAAPPPISQTMRAQMSQRQKGESGSVDSAGVYHSANPTHSSKNQDAAAGSDEKHKSKSDSNIKILKDGCVALGEIIIDPKQRKMTFPVEVNTLKTGTPLEYVLVMRQGKTHESLLVTDVPPRLIHVASLLLGLEKEHQSAKSLEIKLTYETNGGPVTVLLSEVITFGEGEKDGGEEEEGRELPNIWKYQGEELKPGFLVASRDGSIISMKQDLGALIVSASPEVIDDEGSAAVGWGIGHFLGVRGSITFQLKAGEPQHAETKLETPSEDDNVTRSKKKNRTPAR